MYSEDIENTKIRVYGSKSEIEESKQVISKISSKLTGVESSDRIILQKFVVEKIHARVLYSGNGVYNKTKLLKHFSLLLSRGMDALTNDLYEFFHLCCGTIAHYNKQGWICEYPNVSALRRLFQHNEFGQSVLNCQPSWATDRIEIVKEMSKMLNSLSE